MIVLRNATIVHLHPAEVIPGVEIVIEGSRIHSVGKSAGEALKPSRSIDLAGRLVMPGLVCGHDHFYSGLSRGILARIAPTPDFVSTLQNLWWKLDRALTRETVSLSAQVCALEAVKAGCSAVIDHHASPSFIDGSLSVMKEGFEKAGLRGILCYETTDRNGRDGANRGVAENVRFARQAQEEKTARGEQHLVEAMIGGHAPFTLSDEDLKALGDAVVSTGRGFHVHVAEDTFDSSFSHRVYGKDPLARLDGFGLLTDGSLIGHGLYLTAADRDLLNSRGACLAHNSRSNMNNSVGYNTALPHIKNVVLGTDGIGSDMLLEAKFAYFRHRDSGGPLGPGAFMRFLQSGNDLLRRCFGEQFGRVEKGYKADLVILDYDSPTPLVRENVAGHALFGMGSRDVNSVIVNGKIVMENRTFPWDVRPVYAEAQAAARSLWQQMDRL
ncbi:MAG TPA: putative aminohydrolase SsnA [Spirochaetia bacterium]|nr:putative aminohydrolase SsnA [Spirochaetia bacterium]